MAIDPRKRQKKLEKRRAKQKAERRAIARQESRGMAGRLQDASAAPILHCFATADVWDRGIGNVVISRQLPNGTVAFAAFLVDTYCLGVKDVFMNIVPRSRYEEGLYRKITSEYTTVPLKPECLRKLVEGAVAYALSFDLAPHPDYRTASMIFGDIPVESCTEKYVYGKDGKPFFVAGPYDSPAKCQHIIRTLERHCGPKGYHFLMPLSDDMEDMDFIEEGDEPPEARALPR